MLQFKSEAERAAWTRFLAALLANGNVASPLAHRRDPGEVAATADLMLEQWRARNAPYEALEFKRAREMARFEGF